jgi:phosphoglucosamine mutase
MVSASHNPWTDNGIKLFAAGGRKIPDTLEAELAGELDRFLAGPAVAAPAFDAGADASADTSAAGDLAGYTAHLVASLSGRDLGGLAVVLDCANGAASALAAGVFTGAGARVEVINASPDGRNINRDCGSTHLGPLASRVVATGAALGLAFDGDADRVLAVDHTGAPVDGDHLIALLALDRHRQGTLPGPAVVVTVMSNLGLRLAMADAGIEVVETPVGDRHCLEALEARSLVLGGEQSGHVIFRDLATTGDGMLCGLAVADAVVRSGATLAELAATAMTRVPQVLVNVTVVGDRDAAMASLAPAVAAAEERLGDTGRVLVRPSGTEPLIRVMVEATGDGVAAAEAARLVGVLEGSPDRS